MSLSRTAGIFLLVGAAPAASSTSTLLRSGSAARAANKQCKTWCATSFTKNSADKVCTWGACSGCEDCADKECKGWCANSVAKKGADAVCNWAACAGCDDCTPPPAASTSTPAPGPAASTTATVATAAAGDTGSTPAPPASTIDGCVDTQDWSNKYGKTCADYDGTWCSGGTHMPNAKWAMGIEYGLPEDHCCACGKLPDEVAEDPVEASIDEEPKTGCDKHNPCRNHGKCHDGDKETGPSCECVASFTGKYCEEEPIPGDIRGQKPSAGTDIAALAVTALNARRAKNEMSPVELDHIVTYSKQVVAGILHTLCIKTKSNGFVQLVWDDFEYGEGPHLASVMPLHKSIKWLSKPSSTFVCALQPVPFDRRAGATSLLLEIAAAVPSIKLSPLTAFVESKGDSEATDLPDTWDARVDHARGEKCKAMIEHPYNQGTCGSCYAFAALGTASIRACIAGHDDIATEGFSIQDVLNCGSVWEGDFQNKVLDGAEGTNYAGNCDGHKSINVFEYATKYGLVDSECQAYAHSGDPLTHFDADAGAKECLLTNNGEVPATPAVDIWVKPSEEYVSFINSLEAAIYESDAAELTADQRAGMKALGLDYGKHTLKAYPHIVKPHMAKRIPVELRDNLVRMERAAPIAPGATVSVDSMRFCANLHPSNKYNFVNVEKNKGGEPHCLVKFNVAAPESAGLKASCTTHPGAKVALHGPVGEIVGGIENDLCQCAVKNLVFEKNGAVFDFDDAKDTPSFSELGSHARGTCRRNRATGAFNFKNGGGCGKVHNIFHTPVGVSGDTQSERLMKKAIMSGGAISVSFATTDSFMHFDGEGVYDMEPGEELDGGHAVVFFGWGVESDGTKFWWGKNSWGPGPANIFKFARGRDVCTIESRGAAWLEADAPGAAHTDSVSLQSSNPNGFCADSLLDASMTAEKMEMSCVSIECQTSAGGDAGDAACFLRMDCPTDKAKTTVVDLIADANYNSIARTGRVRARLNTVTACIENVYQEDRS